MVLTTQSLDETDWGVVFVVAFWLCQELARQARAEHASFDRVWKGELAGPIGCCLVKFSTVYRYSTQKQAGSNAVAVVPCTTNCISGTGNRMRAVQHWPDGLALMGIAIVLKLQVKGWKLRRITLHRR